MSSISIFFGSVYGNAENVAQEIHSYLVSKNLDAKIIEDPSVQDFKEAETILVISSTTGQGDVPPNLEWAISDLNDQRPVLNDKPFVVAALGDSSYGESYCGAGKHVFELLLRLGAKPLTDMLAVDAIESMDSEEDVLNWIKSIPDL